MTTKRTPKKISRADAYRQSQSKAKGSSQNKPHEAEFHMTQGQKAVMVACVASGVLTSWILQAMLGLKGMFSTALLSGLGGGAGSIVALGIIFLFLMTPDQKRKHLKRKK